MAKQKPFNIPTIHESLKRDYHAKQLTLTEVAWELFRTNWTSQPDLNYAAQTVGVVDIVLEFSDRSGKAREFYVRLEPAWRKFRFTLCPEIRTIQTGETLEQAAQREMASITRRTWPDRPQFWIDAPELCPVP